jgi:hypothetical protein
MRRKLSLGHLEKRKIMREQRDEREQETKFSFVVDKL